VSPPPANQLSKRNALKSENPFLTLTSTQQIELRWLNSRPRVDTRRPEGRWDIQHSSLPPEAKRTLIMALRQPFGKIRNGYYFVCIPESNRGLWHNPRILNYRATVDKASDGRWVGRVEGLGGRAVYGDSEKDVWTRLVVRLLASIRNDTLSGRRVTRYTLFISDPVSKAERLRIREARNKLHHAQRLIRIKNESRIEDGSTEGDGAT
jgi:hypothetical protein